MFSLNQAKMSVTLLLILGLLVARPTHSKAADEMDSTVMPEANMSYISDYQVEVKSIENQIFAQEGPSDIGQPWTFEDMVLGYLKEGVGLFSNQCIGMVVELYISPTPYQFDAPGMTAVAGTLRLTKTRAQLVFFPAFFTLTEDLVRKTVIHEFGHACGLPHNTNKASIMYPLIDKVEGNGIADETDRKTLEVLWHPRHKVTVPQLSR